MMGGCSLQLAVTCGSVQSHMEQGSRRLSGGTIWRWTMSGVPRAAVADAAIGRIDRWLRQHAPRVRAALRPPASEQDLAAVEEAVDQPVPSDLLSWWSDANGASPQADSGSLVPPSFVPYSVADALRSRRTSMEVARQIAPIPIAELEAFISSHSSRPAGTRCETWLPAWLPIASDHGGAHLFVDLRSGRRHGCVMQFYRDMGAAANPEMGGRRRDAL
ncbi:SMI1/KNR4 family protein [Micromonospora cremea]|uniref:SMI1/KNR4 family protein n=1 Tax=Micromonospora cremea TaxID=709881 RepID=UPI000A04CF98